MHILLWYHCIFFIFCHIIQIRAWNNGCIIIKSFVIITPCIFRNCIKIYHTNMFPSVMVSKYTELITQLLAKPFFKLDFSVNRICFQNNDFWFLCLERFCEHFITLLKSLCTRATHIGSITLLIPDFHWRNRRISLTISQNQDIYCIRLLSKYSIGRNIFYSKTFHIILRNEDK